MSDPLLRRASKLCNCPMPLRWGADYGLTVIKGAGPYAQKLAIGRIAYAIVKAGSVMVAVD